MKQSKADNVFVVWRAYQGRVDSMRRFFEFQPLYFARSFRRRAFRPIEYILKSIQTMAMLLGRQPSIVWFQLPPTPLLYIMAFYKWMHPQTFTVADCHNGVIGPWAQTPGMVRLLNSAVDLILVHNEFVEGEISTLGVETDHCLVLEDAPAQLSSAMNRSVMQTKVYPRPWVLFPAGFDSDEPVDQLLKAAASTPSITYVITGNTTRARGRHDLSLAPANAVFTGWVDTPRYKELLSQADILIGLTTMEGVALSVASEAVGAGKAMVLSDTAVLRELFPKGAVYVGPESGQIAAGVLEALAHRKELEIRVLEGKAEKSSKWDLQAAAVYDRLVKFHQETAR